VFKLDNLLKHASRHKAWVLKLGIAIGPFYFDFKS
jgi:hypothetical protein